jgi:hypothetical protein
VAKVARVWLRMTYRCCGMEWTDDWPTPLKLECPDCRELVEPHEVTELEPEQPAKIRARHPQRWNYSKLAS